MSFLDELMTNILAGEDEPPETGAEATRRLMLKDKLNLGKEVTPEQLPNTIGTPPRVVPTVPVPSPPTDPAVGGILQSLMQQRLATPPEEDKTYDFGDILGRNASPTKIMGDVLQSGGIPDPQGQTVLSGDEVRQRLTQQWNTIDKLTELVMSNPKEIARNELAQKRLQEDNGFKGTAKRFLTNTALFWIGQNQESVLADEIRARQARAMDLLRVLRPAISQEVGLVKNTDNLISRSNTEMVKTRIGAYKALGDVAAKMGNLQIRRDQLDLAEKIAEANIDQIKGRTRLMEVQYGNKWRTGQDNATDATSWASSTAISSIASDPLLDKELKDKFNRPDTWSPDLQTAWTRAYKQALKEYYTFRAQNRPVSQRGMNPPPMITPVSPILGNMGGPRGETYVPGYVVTTRSRNNDGSWNFAVNDASRVPGLTPVNWSKDEQDDIRKLANEELSAMEVFSRMAEVLPENLSQISGFVLGRNLGQRLRDAGWLGGFGNDPQGFRAKLFDIVRTRNWALQIYEVSGKQINEFERETLKSFLGSSLQTPDVFETTILGQYYASMITRARMFEKQRGPGGTNYGLELGPGENASRLLATTIALSRVSAEFQREGIRRNEAPPTRAFVLDDKEIQMLKLGQNGALAQKLGERLGWQKGSEERMLNGLLKRAHEKFGRAGGQYGTLL